MKTVTLSGWGQPHDALTWLVAGSQAIDYSHASSPAEAIRMIASLARDAEAVIGWSLGGQLAARAIAQKAIAPEKLVLIATPFQFVGEGAQGQETFKKFHGNYKANPKRTLDKAWELIHYEDSQSSFISDQLALFDKDAVLKKDWLRWLEALEHYSCDEIDFSGFPNTMLVHGAHDKVVMPEQSQRFAEKIKGAKVHVWEECGHAPHFHNAGKLQKLIHAFFHV